MPGYASDAVTIEKEAPAATWTAVAAVLSVTPPEIKRNFVEPRIQGSDYPVVIPTSQEAQSVTLKLLFDPDLAGHKAFETDLAAKTVGSYRISYPGTTPRRETFSGYVESFVVDELPAEGKEITATVVFKLSAKRTTT